MIEFNGVISESCARASSRHITKSFIIFWSIITATVCITATVIAIVNGTIIGKGVLGVIVLTLLFAVPLILVIIIPKHEQPISKAYHVPVKVIIDTDKITHISYLFKKEITRPISKVTKVIDAGEFYDIYFRFTTPWLCEKKLLIKGTIEEFEKIFEGKIVRKFKQGKMKVG